jgi:hypothetical protein
MAELTHALTVDEERRLVNSTSWTSFTGQNIQASALEGNTEYLLMASALIMGSDVDRNDFYFRLHDGALIGDSDARLEPRDTSSLKGEMYFWMDRYTTAGTPTQINFQSRTDATSTTQRSISMYMLAIKLADLEDGVDFIDGESLTNLTGLDNTGWTGGGFTIDVGDGVSDWLVFGYCRALSDSSGTQLRMRLTDDGVQVGEAFHLEVEDPVEVRQWGFMWALEGIPSSTLELEFQTNSGTVGLVDIDRNMLFALRLNVFQDYLIDDDTTDVEITAIDTDFGNISVSHTTHTGGASRDWAVFGSAVIGTGDAAKTIRHHIKDGATRLVGDSTEITDGLMQDIAGASDQMPNLRYGEYASVAHNASLTANIKNQENNDVSPTPDILDAHIGWFTWELKGPHLPYLSKRYNTLLRM